jgi:putative spermidine/putrescine transport system ATP-binding protein
MEPMSDDQAGEVMLSLEGVGKSYQTLSVVKDFNVTLRKGELISLLGPSGCGKTTTLRMIGGLVQPTDGRIVLRSRDITHEPPHRRDTVMVFQSYALFPHMTAQQNIAFGLQRRGVARPAIGERVAKLLDLLNLRGLRWPAAARCGCPRARR